MDFEQVRVGQRVRINVPGIGDHRQAGTLKKVQGGKCYVHLDWDQHPQHRVMFYPTSSACPTRWGRASRSR